MSNLRDAVWLALRRLEELAHDEDYDAKRVQRIAADLQKALEEVDDVQER